MSDPGTTSAVGDGGEPVDAGSAERAAEALVLYRRHRIDDQADFYAARSRTYERARRQAVTAAAVLLVFAAMFGALGAADADRRALWAFIGACMSAAATAIATYEAAFGFERFSRQYKDTLGALRIAESGYDPGTDAAGAFVSRIEALLRSEVDTWSQLANEREDGEGQ